MKRKPRTELTIVAIALLAVATALLVMVLMVIPAYRAIFNQPWHNQFSTQEAFHFYRSTHARVLFILFPCLAVLQICAAWKILSCARKLSNPEDAGDRIQESGAA
jgi:hypothetical protein